MEMQIEYCPSEAVYKCAPADVLEAASQKLRNLCAGRPEPLFTERALVGPFAWDQLRYFPPFAQLPAEEDEQSFPIIWESRSHSGPGLPGRGFRSAQDNLSIRLLDSVVRSCFVNQGPFRIRPLNGRELDILWSMWPLDSIDEPIFVAESTDHKLVIQLKDGKGTFLDDYQDLSLRRFTQLEKKGSVKTLPDPAGRLALAFLIRDFPVPGSIDQQPAEQTPLLRIPTTQPTGVMSQVDPLAQSA
jgi:hypothetical protein